MRNKQERLSTLYTMSAMLLGTLLLAFAYYHINFQNHLSEGGFVGLALLGKYILDVPPAVSMLLLDIPILILAWFMKGRKFIINTVISVAMFTLFYAMMENYSPIVIDLSHNLLLAAILSGVATGLGAGIVLRFGGATGGDDAISVLISEWSGLKIGTVFFLMDAVVLLLSLFYLPMAETLYTILAVSIAGQIITFTTSYRKTVKPVRVPVGNMARSPRPAVKG
ncbi:YitT family protein [Paenibacillus sp. F411]|uniref:YitT family protein n=1 Tax=Paenibacillus algicola TaxID=2565926 RepID=A0A4P8XL87_9BACL|nr:MULTISPECIES: YitT family protein [Paenibacillus]MBO2945159.1 YitT family protein [Paenibacillus sp. F411]QCT02420.1 protein of unknown function DUF161 [Paenibacillus algicola]